MSPDSQTFSSTGSCNISSETTSTYNLQGRLRQTDIDSDGDGDLESRSTYEYNDAGIRVSQTVETDTTGDGVRDDVTTTDYVIDNNNHTGYAQVLEERNGTTGVIEKTYTLGHDVISQQAPADASGSALFLLPDGHGSTRQLVDATGQPLVGEVYRYDAYGNPIGFDPSAALTTFLYSGEQTDRATGQQYLRARYYDVATGRFNRLDPFAGNLEDPQSLHKYLYAHADPINLTDPTGRFALGGLAIGISLASGFRNIKIESDLLIFDAVVTTIKGFSHGSSANEIFFEFFLNQALGFGAGFAAGKAFSGIRSFLDDGLVLTVGGLRRSSSIARRGIPANANYAQDTFRENFSDTGKQFWRDTFGLNINTVDDLADAIRAKRISADDVPVYYITREGQSFILNTRTSQALERAGVPRSDVNAIDATLDDLQNQLLDGQIRRNDTPSSGFTTVRSTG